jgi:hypothetical protein
VEANSARVCPSSASAVLGSLRPFALHSGIECAPSPPPSYSTTPGSELYGLALEDYDTVNNLTTEQMFIAQFWADNAGQTGTPPGHWIDIGKFQRFLGSFSRIPERVSLEMNLTLKTFCFSLSPFGPTLNHLSTKAFIGDHMTDNRKSFADRLLSDTGLPSTTSVRPPPVRVDILAAMGEILERDRQAEIDRLSREIARDAMTRAKMLLSPLIHELISDSSVQKAAHVILAPVQNQRCTP